MQPSRSLLLTQHWPAVPKHFHRRLWNPETHSVKSGWQWAAALPYQACGEKYPQTWLWEGAGTISLGLCTWKGRAACEPPLRTKPKKESVLRLPGPFHWVFFYSLFLINDKSPSYSTTQISLLKLISVIWTLILCFLMKLETIRTKRQYAVHRIHVEAVWTF